MDLGLATDMVVAAAVVVVVGVLGKLAGEGGVVMGSVVMAVSVRGRAGPAYLSIYCQYNKIICVGHSVAKFFKSKTRITKFTEN